MIFLFYFSGLAAIGSARSITISNNDLEKYEAKLRIYQNMTDIDEENFQEIWTKTLEKCKTDVCYFFLHWDLSGR